MTSMLKKSLFATIALFASGSPAMAQDAGRGSDDVSSQTGIYGAVRAGAGSLRASDLRATSPRVDAITGQRRSSTVAVASAAIGVAPRSLPLRFELEAAWRGRARHRVDAVGTCTVSLCGQDFNFRGEQTARIRSGTLMANAFYDHALGSGLGLFVGAGAGIARLRSSAVQRFDIVQAPQAGTQTGAIWPNRTKTTFSYAISAGLEKRVGRTTFELGGRYVGMGRYDTGYNANLFSDERFSASVHTAEGFLGVRLGL